MILAFSYYEAFCCTLVKLIKYNIRKSRLSYGFTRTVYKFPLPLRFLGTYQVSYEVANQISLQSYISMFTWLILIMGVVFEMPSLAVILSKIGILTKSFLKKYRRHAFVVMLVVAAFITPSGDPFTLMAVGLPLYGLYELSILVCRDFDK